MKYFVRMDFGIVGCSGHGVIEASSYEEAYQTAYDMTVDWASSYGYEQDPDHFGGSLDEVGADWDEEAGEYGSEGSIDPEVEKYDPAQHDGYLI